MKKLLFIFASLWHVHVLSMMPPYNLPAAPPNQPIGGIIKLECDVLDKKFKAGEKITPLQVLKLPLTSSSEAIRQHYLRKRNKTIDVLKALQREGNFEDYTQHPDFLLIQEIGKRLNLLDADGNLIPYADPLPQASPSVIQVEQEIDKRAVAEKNRQNAQNDDRIWVDHWLTPVLVRRLWFWWNGE